MVDSASANMGTGAAQAGQPAELAPERGSASQLESELRETRDRLQSANRDLHKVNSELAATLEALDHARSDLRNLFENTDIATIFLDSRLAIRSFTPAAGEIFNILPTDRGRPIKELSSRLELPHFSADVAEVFAGKQRIECRVQDAEGSLHYLARISPYRDGTSITKGVMITFVNITGLLDAQARQRVLIAELQHRTRNLLAVVQSVARQTIGKGGSLDSFTTRLAALGRVQSMVAEADIDIGDIVRQELHAASSAPNGKVSMAGPIVLLPTEQVQTVALALHELATNAVKHGALQEGPGRLFVQWLIERRDGKGNFLVLEWLECGVKMPEGKPLRIGYGRTVIERSLRFTLRASTKLCFKDDGIHCRIEMPLEPPDLSRISVL